MGAPGPDRSLTSWTSTWQYDGLLLKGSPITYHCPQRVFTLSGAAAGRAELLPAPEIREFSRIRSFSGNSTENSTENSVIFQNWSKTPQKASK